MDKKTTVLMILDGFGLSEMVEGNAVMAAKTPVLDKLMKDYPFEMGYASGLDVGLPDGQMGNSEVGHLNIGAGRIVYQELTRVTKSISDGDFYTNQAFMQAVENCKTNNSSLHLMGLLSDGGVHSHIDHLYALLKLAYDNGLTNVFVHAFLDGRDTAPTSGKQFLSELQDKMREIGVGRIATVIGRYYAMDRDNRWERVKLAYDAMVLGVGNTAESVSKCITKSYDANILDEFVLPTIIMQDDRPTATIKENDSVIFFNFRPDRAREITRTLVDPDFDKFERVNGFFPLKYVTFTQYDHTMPNCVAAYLPQSLTDTLGEYVASQGKTQLRLAETEKYAHVTFFFNGGVEEPNPLEDRLLVPSPKVATYDMLPEMSALLVTEELIGAIKSHKYDLIIINYANCDMVGHTGVMTAAIKAVETIDTCVGKVVETLVSVGGDMFICADHGNSEKEIDYDTKEAFTAHTTNPVPFVLVNYPQAKSLEKGGKLCDIAPTLLEMMGLSKPKLMNGHSLIMK